MQRIFADFNRLGMAGEENVIPLGTDDSSNLQGHTLQDGERAIFWEPGSLEAEGILHLRMTAGRPYWYAVLDLATLRHLDDQPQEQSARAG